MRIIRIVYGRNVIQIAYPSVGLMRNNRFTFGSRPNLIARIVSLCSCEHPVVSIIAVAPLQVSICPANVPSNCKYVTLVSPQPISTPGTVFELAPSRTVLVASFKYTCFFLLERWSFWRLRIARIRYAAAILYNFLRSSPIFKRNILDLSAPLFGARFLRTSTINRQQWMQGYATYSSAPSLFFLPSSFFFYSTMIAATPSTVSALLLLPTAAAY